MKRRGLTLLLSLAAACQLCLPVLAAPTLIAPAPTAVSRSQAWTLLHQRTEDSGADACAWAVETGISDGSDPQADATRAQFVTMLYRFAQWAGMDVSVGEETNILSYQDAFDLPEYAVSAVQWACGAGVLQGRPGGFLDGAAPMTPEEAQLVLERFEALGP